MYLRWTEEEWIEIVEEKVMKEVRVDQLFLVLAKMPEKASEELGRDQGNMVS